MAFSVNKVTLLGNIGKDIDFKTTPDGNALAKFSLATQESFKQNDEWQQRTEWHNIEVWGKLAEFANKHLSKGSKIHLEGKIKTDSYEKDGSTRYITKIIANEIILLDGKQTANTDDAKPQFKDAVSNKPVNKPEPAEEKLSFDDVPF